MQEKEDAAAAASDCGGGSAAVGVVDQDADRATATAVPAMRGFGEAAVKPEPAAAVLSAGGTGEAAAATPPPPPSGAAAAGAGGGSERKTARVPANREALAKFGLAKANGDEIDGPFGLWLLTQPNYEMCSEYQKQRKAKMDKTREKAEAKSAAAKRPLEEALATDGEAAGGGVAAGAEEKKQKMCSDDGVSSPMQQ